MRKVIFIGSLDQDAEKNAPAHCWTEAKTDQVKRTPQRADATISPDASMEAVVFPRGTGIKYGPRPCEVIAAYDTRLTAEQRSFITAIAVRFGVEVDVRGDAHGVTSFCVQQNGSGHCFATLDQVETFLARVTGIGSAARLAFSRGYEARHAFYRDAQKHFEISGDREVAAVFAKRQQRPPIRLNALDLARARLREEAR